METQTWMKIKRSGYFKRKAKSNYLKIVNDTPSVSINKTEYDDSSPANTQFITETTCHSSITRRNIGLRVGFISTPNSSVPPVSTAFNNNATSDVNDESLEVKNNWENELDDDYEMLYNENNEHDYDRILREDLKEWANNFGVKQNALKDLMKLINKRLPKVLPKDPRTLLQTDRQITLWQLGAGHYWHQGFKFCIRSALVDTNESKTISININIDGLPMYRSSKDEFWPILFNIHEMPHLNPMIIGIYCGKSKPSDLNAFLTPFVEEMKDILENGVDIINGHKITVKIRCFICDSPARSFVKGVANFNGQHGCQKCTTVGDYSYISHCNYFPRIHCCKRTDAGFRARMYGSHHKYDTPLLKLPINMIDDFVVADSLHLLDLGIMKRCLVGWRDGTFGSYKAKWSAKDTANISKLLRQCKMPREIHRAVRDLECLAFWKGLEFRTFLYYLGIVVLKPFLPTDIYEHFLAFFCAVTICSSEKYNNCLDLAQLLLEHYIEYYRDFYGEDYITSNVHNLCHVVDDVRKFGILTTFSAYPFESKLYQIKNMIRSGSKPLVQVAKRLSELSQVENYTTEKYTQNFPIVKKQIHRYSITDKDFQKSDGAIEFFSTVQLDTGFSLSTDMENKWFLTKNNEVVGMKSVIKKNNVISLYGCSLKKLSEYFETPIRSSHLNIYTSDCEENLPKVYAVNEIKCKLVTVACNENESVVFIPLLHTL